MNVSLKKWDISDAKDLAEVLSNKKIHDNLRDGLPYPYTEHDGREFITSVLASDENEMFSFAIMAAQKVIGSITAVRQGNIHRQTAELGYYIAEEYWGRGIMAEAVRQFCEHVFETSDMDYCWELYSPEGEFVDSKRHFMSLEQAMSNFEKKFGLYRMASRRKPARQTRRSFCKSAQEADEDKADDLPEFLEEEGDDEDDDEPEEESEDDDEEPAEEPEDREARRAAVRKAMKAARSKAQKRSAAKADEPEKNRPQMRQPVRVQKRSANVAGKPSATYDDTCLFM